MHGVNARAPCKTFGKTSCGPERVKKRCGAVLDPFLYVVKIFYGSDMNLIVVKIFHGSPMNP